MLCLRHKLKVMEGQKKVLMSWESLRDLRQRGAAYDEAENFLMTNTSPKAEGSRVSF